MAPRPTASQNNIHGKNSLVGHAQLTIAAVFVTFVMLLSSTNPELFVPPVPQAKKPVAKPEDHVPTKADALDSSAHLSLVNRAGKPPETVDPKCNAGNKKEWRPAKCQDDKSWLVPWVLARPNSSWTMVDVGANKGYVMAEWLEVLLGSLRTTFTPHNLGVGLYSTNITSDMFKSACGGCCECVEAAAKLPPSARASTVRVFGFEPSPANYRWLRSFFTDTALVNVTHAAVSDRDGEAYFPDNPLGVEIGKVRETPAAGYVRVSVLKLDTYLKDVDFIDVLSTDAEGFDQDVARGASSFIRNGRVGVYQFEMYRAENYEQVFSNLSSWGYVCYFATESRAPRVKITTVSIRNGVRRKKDHRYKVPMVVRITDCWEPEYQSYTGWVNGLCYNTKVPHLQRIFDSLERTLHQGGNGNCPTRVLQRRVVLEFVAKFVHGKDSDASQALQLTEPPNGADDSNSPPPDSS